MASWNSHKEKSSIERKPKGLFRSKPRWATTDFIRNLECQYGLLDYLIQNGCLNVEDVNELKQKYATERERNNKLVSLIDNSNTEKFTDGLEKSNQGHLVNYMRKNGIRDPPDDDNWPLRDVDKAPIIKSFPELVHDLYSKSLMDHLLITGCLSAEQLATVDNKGITQEKNRELLHILMRRSVRQLNIFYDCLKDDHLHLWSQLLKSKEKEVYTIDLIENTDSQSTNIAKEILERKQRILQQVEDISIDMAATLLEDTLYLIKKKKAAEQTGHQASWSGIQSAADFSISGIRKFLTQILGTDDNMNLNITRLDNATSDNESFEWREISSKIRLAESDQDK